MAVPIVHAPIKPHPFPAILKWFLTTLTAAVIGAGVVYGVSQYAGRLRYLNYYTESSLINDTLKTTVISPKISGNARIPSKDVTKTRVVVFNTNDTDFEDVIIYITVHSFAQANEANLKSFVDEEQKNTGIEIAKFIDSRINMPTGSYEKLDESIKRYEMRAGYKVKVANRGREPFFDAAYFFTGDIKQAQTVKVTVMKKGVAGDAQEIAVVESPTPNAH